MKGNSNLLIAINNHNSFAELDNVIRDNDCSYNFYISDVDKSFDEKFWYFTALQFAVIINNYNAVLFLLRHGADINNTDNSGMQWTALHCAVWYSRIDILELLLQNGANPDSIGRNVVDKSKPFITPIELISKSMAMAFYQERFLSFYEARLEMASIFVKYEKYEKRMKILG